MGEGINFSYKVLVLELSPGEVLNSIVESLGDREEVKPSHESFKVMLIFFPDGFPSDERGVIEFHFVGFRDVGVDWTDVRDHGAERYG